MKPRIGGLFEGYSGLTMAAQKVFGGELAWYSEIDPGALKILGHRFPGVVNLGDITAVDWSQVEPIDILTGGYPCQPFSYSGSRKGTNDDRHLWPHVREAIRHLRPRITILENVAGHLSLGFDRVLGDLAEDGLDVRWTSIRAADIGAPHSRPRVFIVATDPGGLGGLEAVEHDGRGAQEDNGAGVPDERGGDALWAGPDGVDLGPFAGAVAHWERVLGRRRPPLVAPGPRGNLMLSPRFVEWMQGLPDGWVTDVPGITRGEALQALGNGVCPPQAVAAIRSLCPSTEAVAA